MVYTTYLWWFGGNVKFPEGNLNYTPAPIVYYMVYGIVLPTLSNF